MENLSKRWLLVAATLAVAIAAAAVGGQAVAGGKDGTESANGLGRLSGLLPRDHLTGGKPRSARTRCAEDVPEHAADTAQYRAEAAGRLRLPRPVRRMRCSNRPTRGTGL